MMLRTARSLLLSACVRAYVFKARSMVNPVNHPIHHSFIAGANVALHTRTVDSTIDVEMNNKNLRAILTALLLERAWFNRLGL